MQIKPDKSFLSGIHRELTSRLKQVGKELTDHVKVKVSRGRRGHTLPDVRDAIGAGEPPHVMSGRLRNSIVWEMVGDDTVRIGTTMLHGKWMELGMPPTITAKHGGYMAIPFSIEAWRHNVSGGGPRTFPKKLKLIPSTGRAGVAFLVQDVRGKHARGIIHYVLAKKVKREPHPFLRPGLQEMYPRIQQIFGG